ncbi:hypothetical protein, variant 1 [Aphanomyces astaci]|nr:hypothetical protein, variant 1 [Aphanomyces astaci]ETV70021.1 hypothetical protein, variant 1 [Aphanomyces astaci]|eukprot:XP_009840464.1 hypothetical protein, variant 1 [Aphanomyces astaci]
MLLTRHVEAIKVSQRAIAFDIMERLVGDFIQLEFIPDLLIDIFTTGIDEYTPHPVEVQAMHQFYHALVQEVVLDNVRDIATATVDRLVAAYFTAATNDAIMQATTTQQLQHPWLRLVTLFVHDWIAPFLREIVVEGVDDLVNQYLTAKQHYAFLDTWMHQIIAETAASIHHDIQLDAFFDTLLHDVMQSQLVDVVASEVALAQTAINQGIQRRERALISDTASASLLDHAMLRGLLELLALKADRLAFKDSCDQLLQMMMLKQMLSLQKRQAEQEAVVRSSAVLVACHNQCLQAGLGQLISGLVQRGWDDWENRIHMDELNETAAAAAAIALRNSTKQPS